MIEVLSLEAQLSGVQQVVRKSADRPTSLEGAAFLTRGSYGEGDTLKSHRFPDLQIDMGELAAGMPEGPPLDEVRESVPVYAS